MNNLIYDRPSSQGVANALKRAEMFAKVRWTPIGKMPKTMSMPVPKDPEDAIKLYWKSWQPVHGLPYSSVRFEEKFIGYNVSLETFLTAMANPKSVLYTRNLTGRGVRMSSWYGSVCSAYVGYALELTNRRVCRVWDSYGDMTHVPDADAQQVQLCDVLRNDRHVGMVTAIGRNAAGDVVTITVSECMPPKVVVAEYTVEEFEHCWLEKYSIYRYNYIDRVTYTPSPYVHLEGDPEPDVPPINRVLLPDYGDKANYRIGQPVELNIMESGWDKLVISTEDGTIVHKAGIREPGVLSWTPEEPGFYRAWCVKGGEVSPSVEFCMTDFTAAVRAASDGITLHFNIGKDSEILSCQVSNIADNSSVAIHMLTPEENAARCCAFPIREPGNYNVKAISRNRFGQYCSTPLQVNVEA